MLGEAEIRTLQKESYEVNVANGWHPGDKPPASIQTILALIVSELAEALEEFRAGRMMTYYVCTRTDECGDEFFAPSHLIDPDHPEWGEIPCCPFCAEVGCYVPAKPEGFLMELADANIRILDRAGRMDMDLAVLVPSLAVFEGSMASMSIPDRLFYAMRTVTNEGLIDGARGLAQAFREIESIAKAHSIESFPDAMRTKLAFNRTRGHRHGNKAV